jgi:hypothetical protein
MSDPQVDEAVKRVVARSVLRRLQRLMREDAAREANNARWAKRLALALLAAAVAAVLWLAIR